MKKTLGCFGADQITWLVGGSKLEASPSVMEFWKPFGLAPEIVTVCWFLWMPACSQQQIRYLLTFLHREYKT